MVYVEQGSEPLKQIKKEPVLRLSKWDFPGIICAAWLDGSSAGATWKSGKNYRDHAQNWLHYIIHHHKWVYLYILIIK